MSRAMRNSSSNTRHRLPISTLCDVAKDSCLRWNFPLSYELNETAFKKDIGGKKFIQGQMRRHLLSFALRAKLSAGE